MDTKSKPKVILHGECKIFQNSIPADAVKMEVKGDSLRIAESEVTGNHHFIVNKPGVNFFKSGNTMFMENTEPTNVRCVLGDTRHHDVDIMPGTWEIGVQEEYDYFTQSKQAVRD